MRGWIIPIGGKLLAPDILDRFVSLAGGSNARIAVIPTASSEPDMGTFYERVFERHGVQAAKSLRFERRSDCDDGDWLSWLDDVTGVFLTGGNQLKLSSILGGTPVSLRLRALNASGVHIAGTSAGAAYLSEHMIAYGTEGATPRAGMVNMCAGLGLTNRVIIDQHFRQRDRLGRLLTAVAYNPFCLGLGIDEDTAAFISPQEIVDVMGTGAMTVVDPRNIQHTSIATAMPGDVITIVGATIHVLGVGSSYNLHSYMAASAVMPETFVTGE